jgi:hypothetical protein
MDEENRPHMNNTLSAFRLAEGVEVPDTSGGFDGAEGGVGRDGYVLPLIIFPAKPIDIMEGKVSGGKKGMIDKDSDSSSDSQEDEEYEDTYKLHKLVQAAQKEQPIVLEIGGDHPWEGGFQEVILAKEFRKIGAPAHILEPLPTAYEHIEWMGVYYQWTGIPQSCLWTIAGLPRDQIDVSVSKSGTEVD